MGFGHRPNSHGEGRPSAKYLWSSAVSVKSSKALVSRPVGQVSKGLNISVVRPNFQRSRPLGLSAKSPKHRAARWVPTSPSTGTLAPQAQGQMRKLCPMSF